MHPGTFALDAFDRACDKFWGGLHSLRSPQLLERWLKKVAFSAVVEELRYHKRRTKKWSCSFEPLETHHPDGTVTSDLDRAENRDAATRYRCVTIEQTQSVKRLVHQDILGKLFRAAETGSTRQREGINLLKMMLEEDLTIEEIVAQCRMKKSRVLSLLRSAREQLQRIAETRYKFTAEDL
jgi:DNA-directed RNA polymerase specialized sigma24 family protein